MAKPKTGAGSEANGGEALIAALRKKTGQDRENRPGWSIEVAGTMLGPHLRLDEPDPWAPEQREKGVLVELVELNLGEHERAEGRAAARFARYGGDAFSSPLILIEERAYVALWKVDGRVVPDDDAERRPVWEALGREGRALLVTQYVVLGAENQTAREAAAKRAQASFRVRA